MKFSLYDKSGLPDFDEMAKGVPKLEHPSSIL